MKESRESCAISPSCRATRTQSSFSTATANFLSPRQKPPRHRGAHFWYEPTLSSGGNITFFAVPVTTFPPTLIFQGPWWSSIVIKKAFTWQTSGLVYGIPCRHCPAIYMDETGRTLRQRFGDHLRSIEKNLPGFPVVEHFKAAGNSIGDVLVRGILLCGATSQRKRLEMRLTFTLGTSHPRGLNSDCHFLKAPG